MAMNGFFASMFAEMGARVGTASIGTGGNYPRRGTEDEQSVSDDAREAARSYKQTIDESADAFLRVLRVIGEEAANVGQRVADRVRETRPDN